MQKGHAAILQYMYRLMTMMGKRGKYRNFINATGYDTANNGKSLA